MLQGCGGDGRKREEEKRRRKEKKKESWREGERWGSIQVTIGVENIADAAAPANFLNE